MTLANPTYSQVKKAYRRRVLTAGGKTAQIHRVYEAMKRREKRLPRKMLSRRISSLRRQDALNQAMNRRLRVERERRSGSYRSEDVPGVAARAAARARAARVSRTNPKRKGTKMARSAAQRAAFRKMLAGLKRHRAGSKRRKVRARPRRRAAGTKLGRALARRRSSRRTIVVHTNPTKGASMARRRRRRRARATTIMVNPRRRRARRSRRFSMAPRRHVRHHRRRRNPASGGFLKNFVKNAIPGALVGGAAGFVDAKFLSDKSEMVKIGGKLAMAVGAGLLLRRKPAAAGIAIASILATLGYETGVKAAGGVVAGSPTDATKQLKALIVEDPRAMGALVREFSGLGVDSRVQLGSNELASNALPRGMAQRGVSLG